MKKRVISILLVMAMLSAVLDLSFLPFSSQNIVEAKEENDPDIEDTDFYYVLEFEYNGEFYSESESREQFYDDGFLAIPECLIRFYYKGQPLGRDQLEVEESSTDLNLSVEEDTILKLSASQPGTGLVCYNDDTVKHSIKFQVDFPDLFVMSGLGYEVEQIADNMVHQLTFNPDSNSDFVFYTFQRIYEDITSDFVPFQNDVGTRWNGKDLELYFEKEDVTMPDNLSSMRDRFKLTKFTANQDFADSFTEGWSGWLDLEVNFKSSADFCEFNSSWGIKIDNCGVVLGTGWIDEWDDFIPKRDHLECGIDDVPSYWPLSIPVGGEASFSLYYGIPDTNEFTQITGVDELSKIRVYDDATGEEIKGAVRTCPCNNSFYYIQINKMGSYTMKYEREPGRFCKINIQVTLPKLGIYEREDAKVDSLLRGEVKYDSSLNSDSIFYLRINSDDWRSFCGPPRITCKKAESDSDAEEGLIETMELLNDDNSKLYRVMIPAGTEGSLLLNVGVDYDDSSTENYQVNITDAAFGGRTNYTDGREKQGFSGCFITKEEYEAGRMNYELHSDIYWIHAESIQQLMERMEIARKGQQDFYNTDSLSNMVTPTITDEYVKICVSGDIPNADRVETLLPNNWVKGAILSSGQEMASIVKESEASGIYEDSYVYKLTETGKGYLENIGFPNIPDYICYYHNGLWAVTKQLDESYKLRDDDSLQISSEVFKNLRSKESYREPVYLSPYEFPEVMIGAGVNATMDGKFKKVNLFFKDSNASNVRVITDCNDMTMKEYTIEDESSTDGFSDTTLDSNYGYQTRTGEYTTAEYELPIHIRNLKKSIRGKSIIGSYKDNVQLATDTGDIEDRIVQSQEYLSLLREDTAITLQFSVNKIESATLSTKLRSKSEELLADTKYVGKNPRMVILDMNLSAVTSEGKSCQIHEFSNPIDVKVELGMNEESEVDWFQCQDDMWIKADSGMSMDNSLIPVFSMEHFSYYAFVVYGDQELSPSASPSAPPAVSPSASPVVSPSAPPVAPPSVSPTVDVPGLSEGAVKTVKGLKYKVTQNAHEVALVGAKTKTIRSVDIPASVYINGIVYKVTSIGANAFAGYKKLTKVTVGKNITSIGKKAFANCGKLKFIVFTSKRLKIVGKKAFASTNKSLTIRVPKAKLKLYKKILKGKGQGRKVTIKK